MIKGTSDVRRLPRLGKIRLGEKRKSESSGKEYPAALDHFSFVDVPWVEEVYGAKCTTLDIMIPHENPDVFFPQALKAYRASGLFCQCTDGETALRVRVGPDDKGKVQDEQGEAWIQAQGLDVQVGDMFEMTCPHFECPLYEAKKCKGIGRLLFMLPKVPRFGVYEITTSSRNSMIDINSYVEAIRAAAGRVSMIPLKLNLVEKEVQAEGKKKNIRSLEIVWEGSLQQLTGLARARALPAPVGADQLPSRAELDREVPEDLYAHGGSEPAAKPTREAPRRASEAPKPADPAPAAQETKKADPAKPKGTPETKKWTSKIKHVGQLETAGKKRYTITRTDGEKFHTFDEKLARLAHEAMKTGAEVTAELDGDGGSKFLADLYPKGDL